MGRPRIFTDEERKEKYLKYQREYYLRTKEKRSKYKKKYYEEHKDEYLERWHKWLGEPVNRIKHNKRQREYNARKKAEKDGKTV